MDQAKLEKLVNDSGFPLQLRVEEEVRGSQGSWSVESREHPWRENAFSRKVRGGLGGISTCVLRAWNPSSV